MQALCLSATSFNRAMPLTVAAAWTPPFVLHACSIAAIALVPLIWLCDIRCWWDGTPMRWMGMNTIALYTGHMLFKGWFPFGFEVPSDHGWETVETVLGVTCWALVAWQLCRHGLSIKL